MGRLIDHARCLALKDFQRLEHRVDTFERRFPQLNVVVFLGALLPSVTAAEAGFWLLNQGIAERSSGLRVSRWGLAVIVDPVERRAGVAMGYGLEACLPHNFAHDMLQAALVHLSHDEYVRAVDAMFMTLDRRLRSQGAAQRRTPAPCPPASQPHLGLAVVSAEGRRASVPQPRA